jgi:hypothetical protein
MTDQSAPRQSAITPGLLHGLAAAAGLTLTAEEAAVLVSQAEEHFALLGHLDEVADSSTEPGAEFRLDCWTTSSSD